MRTKREPHATPLDGVANALLLAPSDEGAAADARASLLTARPPRRENVVIVSYDRTFDEWLATWEDEIGDLPPRFGFVGVGETMRSAAASAPTDPAAPLPDETNLVSAAADPTDLVGLGILVGEYLVNWAETEERTVVFFDSLTALLRHADLETAFRFLHTLTNHVRVAGATAIFEIDRTAHDERSIRTLRSLFDAVVDAPSAGGEWDVTEP